MLLLDTCNLRNHSWQLLSFKYTAAKELINYLALREVLGKEDFIQPAVPEDRPKAGDNTMTAAGSRTDPDFPG